MASLFFPVSFLKDCWIVSFVLFLTDSHQPLLNHHLPFVEPLSSGGSLGILDLCPVLVLETLVGTVSRTGQGKKEYKPFLSRK